jgi:hypothetical protein
MTRSRQQLTRDRVRLHKQIESLLEDAHIKLSGRVSDLLGLGSRRMLRGLAEGPMRRFGRPWLSRNCAAAQSNCRMPCRRPPAGMTCIARLRGCFWRGWN